MSARTIISLVEDDAQLRELWARRLRAEPDFLFLDAYVDAESALAALPLRPPDLLLVDWQLPGMDGLALIERLKEARPELRTVLVTNHDLKELPFAAFAAGADSFLLKTEVTLRALPVRLREVMAGHCPIAGRSARHLIETLRNQGALSAALPLAPRELEVLRLLADGLSTKQVAHQLRLSDHTVVSFKRRIYKKLDAHNLAEAVAHWRGGRRGIRE